MRIGLKLLVVAQCSTFMCALHDEHYSASTFYSVTTR